MRLAKRERERGGFENFLNWRDPIKMGDKEAKKEVKCSGGVLIF